MAGLEELKKKLQPLFDADKGLPSGLALDPCDSYMVICFKEIACMAIAKRYYLGSILHAAVGHSF